LEGETGLIKTADCQSSQYSTAGSDKSAAVDLQEYSYPMANTATPCGKMQMLMFEKFLGQFIGPFNWN
jgi:hypothetical protein